MVPSSPLGVYTHRTLFLLSVGEAGEETLGTHPNVILGYLAVDKLVA